MFLFAKTSNVAVAENGLLDWLEDPRTLEIVILILLFASVLWVLFRIRGAVRRVQGRREVQRYLEGVEACLAGDPEQSAKLLEPVVREDPENLGARLALGEAYFRLGRPAEAHRQHKEAELVFEAEGAAVQLAIIRDLRHAGETREAAECAEEALSRYPRDMGILEEAFELRVALSEFQEAMPLGRRLLGRREGDGLRRRLAHVAARAAAAKLEREEPALARSLVQEALSLDPENHEARRCRLLLAEDFDLNAQLLPPGDESHAVVRSSSDAQAPVVQEGIPPENGAVPALDLFPEAICSICRLPIPRSQTGALRCPHCEDGKVVYIDSGMTGRLDNAGQLLDEIEENEHWLERLAKDAAEGNELACRSLMEAGERAARPALVAAVNVEGEPPPLLHAALVYFGRRHPEALLTARRELITEGTVFFGLIETVRLDPLLEPVFRELGEAPLESFRKMLREGSELADKGLRGLVVHYFFGLGRIELLEELGARYSPVEVVRHLNRVPSAELGRLIAQVPEEPCYFREAILLDASLDQELAFVEALRLAEDEKWPAMQALFALLTPSPDLLAALVGALTETGPVSERAEHLLRREGKEAASHLVAAFADPDLDPVGRDRVELLLMKLGAAAVPALSRCFGSGPGEVDLRAIDLLGRLGKGSEAALIEAYRQKPKWLGVLPTPGSRVRHPKSCKLRALARIPGRLAKEALETLQSEEKDPELTSLIGELLRERKDDAGSEEGRS